MMSNKAGNIFEQHLDKVLMSVVALVSLILLFRFFIAVPYKEEIRGQTVSPGNVDSIVNQNANRLAGEIAQPAKREKTYNQQEESKKFSAFLELAVRDFNTAEPLIDTSLYAAVPSGAGLAAVGGPRQYQRPDEPVISDAVAGLFRCVGYVPTVDVTADAPYGSVPDTLADVDLVSVQAELDYQALADSFMDSFNGRTVKDTWRDSLLAEPIIAAVGLQRQQLNSDGSWSDWQDVGFTKINSYKNLLSFGDKIDDIQTSNISTLAARLAAVEVRDQILQPPAYDFVYPNYDWISPKFEEERQIEIQKEKELARRSAVERPAAAAPQERTTRRPERTAPAGAAPGGGIGMPGMGGGVMGMPGGAPAAPARQTNDRRAQRQQELEERQKLLEQRRAARTTQPQGEEVSPEEKFYEIQIDETTDLNQLEKVVFWAHDDTAQEGATYRYRIRLGVVNPIAGKNGWTWADSNSAPTDFIIWSNFAPAKEVIKIPKRTYIFATDVKRQADKTVSVEVAKYNLGNWRKQEFLVRPGEQIGSVVQMPVLDGGMTTDRDKQDEDVDFNTNSIMLDISEVVQWAGRSLLSPQKYFEFIYGDKNGQIFEMPVKRSFWSKETSSIYSEIEDAVKNPVSLSGTRQTGGSRTPSSPAMPGGGMMPGGMGMPDMMMPGMPGM